MNYSVLMSVYDKENAEYLRESMNSVWNQKMPTNDLVLVCDGPLNRKLEAVISEMENCHKDHLQVIRLEQNMGLGYALNEGIQYCRNSLIARMDSDDICCRNRFEKQIKLFEDNSCLDICSGTILEFEGDIKNLVGKRVLPQSHEEIIIFSKKRNPMNHPAVMFKKEAVIRAGGYNERFHLFEDYYLWIRMLMNGSISQNIAEPLVYMRTSREQLLRRGGVIYTKEMMRLHWWIRKSKWSSWLDFFSGAVPHMMVCLLPNRVRRVVYYILHSPRKRREGEDDLFY